MKRLLTLLLLPWLSHCASLSGLLSSCPTHPEPLNTALWNESVQALQRLRLTALSKHACSEGVNCDQAVQTIATLQRDGQGLRLRALSPLGPQWLQVDWRNGELSSQRRPGVPEQLQAAGLVADAQLVHWPLNALQQALGQPWLVRQHGQQRDLYCDGLLISQVHYPADHQAGHPIILSNRRAGYRLEIFALNPP